MIAVTRAKRSSSLPSHLGSLFLICCQIGLLILVVGQRANAGDERKIPPPKRVPEQERKIVYLMDMPAEDEPVITDVVDRLADELPDTIPLADVARMVLDVLALTPISDQVEMGKILKKYSVVELLYFNRYDVRRCSRGEIEARKDVCAQIRGELDSDNLSTRNNLFRYCSHCAQLFESKCSRQTDRIFHDRIIKDEANVSRLLRLGELFEKINQFVMKTAGDKRKDESKRDIVKFINKKGLPEVQLAYYTCADVLEELPDYLYFKKNIQLNYDYLQNQFDKYKLIHKKGWPIRSDKSPAHNQADVIAEAVARCDDLVEAFNEYKNKLTRGGQNKREPKMEQQKKVQKDRQRGDGEKKMKKNSREGEVVQKKKVQLEEEPKKKVQKKKIGQEKVLKDGQKKRPKKVEEESEDEEDEEEDEDEDEEEEDEEEEDEEEVEEEDEEEDEEEEEEENEPRKVQKKSGQEKFLKDRQKKRPKKVEEESEDEEEEDEPRKVQKKKKGQEKVLKDGQKKRPKKVEEYSEEEEEEDEPRKVQKKKKKGQEKVLKDGQKKRQKKVE